MSKEREWLKELIKQKGTTGKAIAEELEIEPRYISMIITGTRKPSVELGKKIATILQFDWVKFYEEPKEVED